jgi:uncharacterized protein YegJ (DUF2314 family)
MRILSFIICLTTFLACQNNASDETVVNEDSNVIYLSDDAKANLQAIDSAQANMETFSFIFMAHYEDSTYSFFAKAPFNEGDLTEHMWVNILALSADTLKGVLDNEPEQVTNFSHGDYVSFATSAVEDLMVYQGDSLIFGSYLQQILE